MKNQGFVEPHLCLNCPQLVLDFSPERNFTPGGIYAQSYPRLRDDRPLSDEKDIRSAFHDFTIFDLSYKEICFIAAKGCALADFLQKVFESDTPQFETLKTPEEHLSDFLRGGRPPKPVDEDIESRLIGARRNNGELHIGRFKWVRKWSRGHQGEPDPSNSKRPGLAPSNKFYLINCEDKVEEEQAIGIQPINILPGSQAALAPHREQIRSCLEKHDSCPKMIQDEMPTRLLNVHCIAGEANICLVETRNINPAPYAALTYCWGGPQAVKTTTSNLESHLQSIRMHDLPQTLRDAVMVARSLELEYLWIDALCIIQDSDDDKALEIAKMAQIYENATIVIGAARATTANTGFLGPRQPMGTQNSDLVFKLPFRTGSGSGAVVILPQESTPVEPIDLRAWTLQERLLATRYLEFGSWQTRFACSSMRRHEIVVDGWSTELHHETRRSDSDVIDGLPMFKRLLSKNEGGLNAEHLWTQIVQRHSSRLLTDERDRLSSLAGIAARFSELLGDQYVCGHWRRTLPGSLLWGADRTVGKLDRPLAPRPCIYVAPSWAWPSINAEVDLNNDTLNAIDLKVTFSEPVLEHVHTVFGAVRKGHIDIEGHVLAARWHAKRKRVESDRCSCPHLLAATEFLPDTGGFLERDIELLMLLFATSKDGTAWWLALERKDVDQYVRVGRVYYDTYKAGHQDGVDGLSPLALVESFENTPRQSIRIY